MPRYYTITKCLLSTLLVWAMLLTATRAEAQAPRKPNAAEIQLALKKLNVLAGAMYIGAHPDDENTGLIAYLSHGALANTSYLSLTRGDGGQNRIGPEIRELLGITRTQELLAARRIDGGKQFFSRANDFGYSKHPDETFNIWDKEAVLSDAVWAIRSFRPDILITRFPVRPGETHGHHTASSIIAEEAFEAAGDPKRFPEQLKFVKPWQPKRLMWNTSPFFYRNRDDFDDTGTIQVNIGAYNPLLGKSYSEIAAESRSMHKSQGFGSSSRRGELISYMAHTLGDKAEKTLFDGVNMKWSRLRGGLTTGALLWQAYNEFNPEYPDKTVSLLLEARRSLTALGKGYWQKIKLEELDTVLMACLGLYLEVSASDYSAIPGGQVDLSVEAVNRSRIPVTVESVRLSYSDQDSVIEGILENNIGFSHTLKETLPVNMPLSQPYWLEKGGSLGMFEVKKQQLIGLPENAPAIIATFLLNIDGDSVKFTRPVVYRWSDPVAGEQYRPFEVVPEVAVNFSDKILLFANEESRRVELFVLAGRADIEGEVRLELPEGWRSEPVAASFKLRQKGEQATIVFKVFPPTGQAVGQMRAVAKVGGKEFTQGLVRIEYDHIPVQTLFPEATTKVVRLDIERKGDLIGYIQGAGDDIPNALRQIGYEVEELQKGEMSLENLKRFDAVILGVRAYNTLEDMRFYQSNLFRYIEEGGTMIVQYNTNHRLKVDEVAPYPLKLSRDRVTVEEAEVRILKPDHAILNSPNKITGADFEGWVQERGLYFPNEWDEHFEALLSSNDPGEPPRDGGLLVANYGEGHFIYTGYSWFRELPAGVPGAFRIFANLISAGK